MLRQTQYSGAAMRRPISERTRRLTATLLRRPLLTTIVLLLAAVAARATDPVNQPYIYSGDPLNPGLLLWDQCGWEGVRACNGVDKISTELAKSEATGSFFAAGSGCDKTLRPDSNAICRDVGGRSSNAAANLVPSWLAFQQSDQYNRISADLPVNLVPMLGTHNSYSNPQDGDSIILDVDQIFTITDQLNMGARYVRLDPLANDTASTVILCHTSPFQSTGAALGLLTFLGLPNVDSPQLCASTTPSGAYVSYQRPLYLAIEEIAHWLQQHPGEVVVIECNNFFTAFDSNNAPIKGYVSQTDLELIFQHSLGSVLLTRSNYKSQFPNGATWPTLRQIRSLGKQALVIFHNFDTKVTGGDDVVWQYVSTGSNSANANFFNCFDSSGNVVPNRDGNSMESIGEDRSLSNVFNPASSAGLMSWLDAAMATSCGYGSISLDYFYALAAAPKVFLPFLGNIDYTTGGAIYHPGSEERPQFTIWSWLRETPPTSAPEPAALVHQTSLSSSDQAVQVALSLSPATARWVSHRWQQLDSGTNLPFACAGPTGSGSGFPQSGDPGNFAWKITAGAGNWSKGETQCQQEYGSTYHFWRPMSGSQNIKLTEIMAATSTPQVWLNHFSGSTRALPDHVTLTHGFGDSQTPTDIVVTSGVGGPLTASFSVATGTPNFLTVTQSFPGNIFQLTANDQALSGVPSGQYQGALTITEQHPDGSPSTTSTVLVDLVFSKNQFTGNPARVDFVSSLNQSVQLTSLPQNVQFTYDQSQTPAWLSISFDAMQTPTTMRLTLIPSHLPAGPAGIASLAAFSIVLNPADGSYPSLKIPVIVISSKVTIGTSPVDVKLVIDGVGINPGTYNWVVGSQHQLSTSANFLAGAGTLYQFQDWAGGGQQISGNVSFTTTAPGQDSSIVAQFGTYYALNLASTPIGQGTASASPGPSANGYYAAGSNITLTASPTTGYVFKEFSVGPVNIQRSPAPLTINGPMNVTARFAAAQFQTSFVTNPPGLSIVVDGATYSTPANFIWTPTETHTVSGASQSPDQGRTQFQFIGWHDSPTAPALRTFTNVTSAATYELDFSLQYLVSVQVSPSLAGAVTGAGYFGPNNVIKLQAVAAPGFIFRSYSGDINSTSNPLQLTVREPVTLTANFSPTKAPVLYASSGQRVDLGGGLIQVPIVLNNLASGGGAGDVAITAVAVSGVPTGAGLPTVVTAIPPNGGISVGTILPGRNAQSTITVNWPYSAVRATFTISYTANGGTYNGSKSISIYR